MKTALITGASGGIGSAIAETLANDGFTTIWHYCTHSGGIDEKAQQYHGLAVHADLSDIFQIQKMAEFALDQLGHIDVLVNNAGISVSGLLTDIDSETRRKLFDINIIGAIELTRFLLPPMIHQKNGCIVNISSMWGQVGASCEVDYSATKSAMIGFTKALAQEVAPSGIRVNCVSAGVIQTEFESETPSP